MLEDGDSLDWSAPVLGRETIEQRIEGIYTSILGNSGRRRLVSQKTPTCLLMNKNEKLVAFGYEAEEKYVKDRTKNSYYFHRFKMKLCKREVSFIYVYYTRIGGSWGGCDTPSSRSFEKPACTIKLDVVIKN